MNKKLKIIEDQSEIENYPPFLFPNIGDAVPKGWELVETYFVDSSGFGQIGEPALTVGQFIEKLEVGFAYAIVETGQFQVHIGKFKKGD